MNTLYGLLVGPIKNFFEGLMKFLPTVFTAFFILVIGILLAVCCRVVAQSVFRALRIDGFLERSGLSGLVKRGGIKDNLSVLLARLIGWLIFFVFALTAINTLQISAVGRLFEDFLLYLPSFFAALFILLFGYLVSNFLYRTVLIAAVNAENRLARPMSKAVKYAVMLFAATMAIEQLGIGKGTVVLAFAIIFGGVVLACALAFGLGGKDIAKTYLEKHYRSEKERAEDEINHL